MNWTIALSAAALAITTITAIAGLMYLIMRLMVAPLDKDLQELKQNTSRIKSDGELNNMIELAIANHRQDCFTTIQKLVKEVCNEH